VPVDRVVLATARRSSDALLRQLRDDPAALQGEGIEAVYGIGDCVAPRLIADCVFDGHRLGREIDSANPARALPFLRERREHASVSEDGVGPASKSRRRLSAS
jgi:dimethylamine/trimethylamine dehydrogenase